MNVERMNVERTPDARETATLERRAARHAALADPTRLRIVDLLAFGDRTAGELRDRLGVGSSLLAHHLGILDRAGLVSRSRSEGDARRHYVRLGPGALSGVAQTGMSETDGLAPAPRIVFVCSGNSARSPLAMELWRRSSVVPVASAGTKPARAIAALAAATASRHGLSIGEHVPRRVSDVVRDGDLVVTLCDRAREDLGDRVDLHWSIPNPGTAGTDAAYEAAFVDIAARVARLARRLRIDDGPIGNR